jgi:hypothetical protein
MSLTSLVGNLFANNLLTNTITATTINGTLTGTVVGGGPAGQPTLSGTPAQPKDLSLTRTTSWRYANILSPFAPVSYFPMAGASGSGVTNPSWEVLSNVNYSTGNAVPEYGFFRYQSASANGILKLWMRTQEPAPYQTVYARVGGQGGGSLTQDIICVGWRDLTDTNHVFAQIDLVAMTATVEVKVGGSTSYPGGSATAINNYNIAHNGNPFDIHMLVNGRAVCIFLNSHLVKRVDIASTLDLRQPANWSALYPAIEFRGSTNSNTTYNDLYDLRVGPSGVTGTGNLRAIQDETTGHEYQDAQGNLYFAIVMSGRDGNYAADSWVSTICSLNPQTLVLTELSRIYPIRPDGRFGGFAHHVTYNSTLNRFTVALHIEADDIYSQSQWWFQTTKANLFRGKHKLSGWTAISTVVPGALTRGGDGSHWYDSNGLYHTAFVGSNAGHGNGAIFQFRQNADLTWTQIGTPYDNVHGAFGIEGVNHFMTGGVHKVVCNQYSNNASPPGVDWVQLNADTLASEGNVTKDLAATIGHCVMVKYRYAGTTQYKVVTQGSAQLDNNSGISYGPIEIHEAVGQDVAGHDGQVQQWAL